jgi:hypothetical protein
MPVLEAEDFQVVEMHHTGETRGILVPGATPLQEAAQMYLQTNLESFGFEPLISSLIIQPDGSPTLRVSGTTVTVYAVEEPPAAGTGEDPTVTSASTNNLWAPADGTFRAVNATTGFPRRMVHRYEWNSRVGRNSYDDFAYEHDLKLYDYGEDGVRPFCSNDDFWAVRSYGVMMSTNMPEESGPYFDTSVSDSCEEMDFTWGIFRPGELDPYIYYKTVIGAAKGYRSSSIFELQGQKLSNDCQFLPDSPDCIGLNTGREGVDYQLYVNDSRGWRAPGCYSWLRGSSPTIIAC